MEYEALPSAAELALIADAIGRSVSFERRIRGGQSATTDILRCEDGQRIVLRRHGRWSIGFDDGIAAREHGVLRAVREAGVPVPRVLWSGRFGATTAIVTEHIQGVAIIQPADPLMWGSRLAATIARIHAVEVGPALAGLLRAAPPSPVDLEPSPMFAAHRYGRSLLARRASLLSSVGGETKLVHGDFWPGNLLWRDDEVVAVLDWEAASVGDPVSDIAYCYAEMRYWGLDGAADQFVSEYRNITGSDMASLPYWVATALCRALPDLDSYLDGWRALGLEPDPTTVRERLDAMIEETLDG